MAVRSGQFCPRRRLSGWGFGRSRPLDSGPGPTASTAVSGPQEFRPRNLDFGGLGCGKLRLRNPGPVAWPRNLEPCQSRILDRLSAGASALSLAMGSATLTPVWPFATPSGGAVLWRRYRRLMFQGLRWDGTRDVCRRGISALRGRHRGWRFGCKVPRTEMTREIAS